MSVEKNMYNNNNNNNNLSDIPLKIVIYTLFHNRQAKSMGSYGNHHDQCWLNDLNIQQIGKVCLYNVHIRYSSKVGISMNTVQKHEMVQQLNIYEYIKIKPYRHIKFTSQDT